MDCLVFLRASFKLSNLLHSQPACRQYVNLLGLAKRKRRSELQPYQPKRIRTRGLGAQIWGKAFWF